jgi:antitoxin PrlF
MSHSVITSKGQITIPVSIRKRLNLKTGDKIDFEINEGNLRLIPASKSVSEVFGILSGKNHTAHTIEEINESLKKRIGDFNK